jgi:hypothetical protein
VASDTSVIMDGCSADDLDEFPTSPQRRYRGRCPIGKWKHWEDHSTSLETLGSSRVAGLVLRGKVDARWDAPETGGRHRIDRGKLVIDSHSDLPPGFPRPLRCPNPVESLLIEFPTSPQRRYRGRCPVPRMIWTGGETRDGRSTQMVLAMTRRTG